MEAEARGIRAGWPAMIGHNLAFLLTGGWLRGVSHLPPGPHDVPADFFGIDVASSPDPACDDYVIARLEELGVRCVRLDLPGDGSAPHARRFLDRLLAAGFRVLLHPVQPGAEAARMPSAEARDSWRRFLAGTLDAVGAGIEMLEAGSTVNRRAWCRYSLAGFLAAWDVAHEECRRRGVTLAGPNVTDFEPLYNIGLLGILRGAGRLPAVHTTNLFAERAIEPERFDHKIGGERLGQWLRFNLIRKAAWLAAVSRRSGVARTFSTHAAWSRRRIDRILPNTEEKQADYLARYCCLAAASGALDRVYWGPLIGQREGLIDDGTAEYPDLPHVFCYALARGRVADYAVRPAFGAFRTAVRLLAGARYEGFRATAGGLEIHEFTRDGRTLHVAWTMDGCLASVGGCYEPGGMESVSCFSRDGLELPGVPEAITEAPVYILWPAGVRPALRPAPAALSGVRVSVGRNATCRPVSAGRWDGLYRQRVGESDKLFHALLPEELEAGAGKKMLRDAPEAAVWACPDPRDLSRTIVVRRWPVRNRGREAWNAANELLRRGVPAEIPVACFEAKPPGPAGASYFVGEGAPADFTAGQAFAALARGEPGFRGVPADSIRRQMAAFLRDLHGRGAFLGGGSPENLLVRLAGDGRLEFRLVDTVGARFGDRSLPRRLRLRDLAPLLRPLPRAGREQFLAHYFGPV